MEIYGMVKPTTLYYVEALLYIQEVQVDKFRQELIVASATANIAYANDQIIGVCGNMAQTRSRGQMSQGRGHGRGHFLTGTRSTCQLRGKYGHVVVDCWHEFDETFTLNQSKIVEALDEPTNKYATSTSESQAIALMASISVYSLPKEPESQAWFMDLGDYHHLTSNLTFLHSKQSYEGHSRVIVANGESLPIHGVGSSHVSSLA